VQRHLADGMRRAAQARVVAADGGFDAVEHAFLQFVPFDVFFGDGEDGAVHSQVVVPGGDNQVDLFDAPFSSTQ